MFRRKKVIPNQWFTCNERWDEMKGDDFARKCQSCNLTVYDLRGLDVDEIRKFIELSEGSVCAKVHTNRDGYIINGQCKKKSQPRIGRVNVNPPTEQQMMDVEIFKAKRRVVELEELKVKMINDDSQQVDAGNGTP